MNRKGDSIPARPHCMARILAALEKLTVITEEQLRSIAPPTPKIDGQNDGCFPSNFTLDEWIAKYCPELGAPQPWKGGRKWVLTVYPFNEAHNNRSAVLIQEASGAIAFKCHHNGCANNNWHALRELKEPGCYGHKAEEYPEVDFSGILNRKAPDAETRERLFPNPGPIPDKPLAVPGFIDEAANLSMSTASPASNVGMALAPLIVVPPMSVKFSTKVVCEPPRVGHAQKGCFRGFYGHFMPEGQ